MFILNSSIPKELYNKLVITEDVLDTLTVSSSLEDNRSCFTNYQGNSYLVNHTWEDLNIITKDTGISLITTYSSFLPFPTIDFETV